MSLTLTLTPTLSPNPGPGPNQVFSHGAAPASDGKRRAKEKRRAVESSSADADAGAGDEVSLEAGAACPDTIGGAAAVGLAEAMPMTVDLLEAWTAAQGKKLIIAAYQGESAKVRKP